MLASGGEMTGANHVRAPVKRVYQEGLSAMFAQKAIISCHFLSSYP